MNPSRDSNNVQSNNPFSKSDIGAQSAWKGFSSQTLYIASRIASNTNNYDYFPEDIEDLIVRNEGTIVEAIQIKNISSDLTLSSLASTKSSKSGDGFFKRVCSLHTSYPTFSIVRIIYFNELGEEIKGYLQGNDNCRKSILKKFTDNHDIPDDYAEWLLSSLVFEKVSIDQLQDIIIDQLKECVPIMAAPDLAQSLLVQHVSDLSNKKGSTNFDQWQEQIYQIGTDIAAIDGYYKEYQKSLLRLCDLALDKTPNQLRNDFAQGISVHPAHIRNSLDINRSVWLNNIAEAMKKHNAVIVKGVSGQGKSALCYRYLINHYPEQMVFCVQRVESTRQAENLAIALKGIAKHTSNMILYIDVSPGNQHWVLLMQELQLRGVSVPVLVSIREEDFKMTQVDGSSVAFELIELHLSKHEAETIFQVFTTTAPHPEFRSFEEAWARFGMDGPFIEFAYLLTNNETLNQRLQTQIETLLRERHPDTWFTLLQLVCFAGKTGCPLIFDNVKREISGNNTFSAIQRLSNEYLIRKSDDGLYIEALHPLRAQIICDVLKQLIGENASALMLSTLKCIDSNYIYLFLMDYFSSNKYIPSLISKIADLEQQDWTACAGLIKTMLWLDVKRYVELNQEIIDDIVKKRGKSWLQLMPLDISGLIRPNEFVIENFIPFLRNVKTEDIKAEIDRISKALCPLHIDFAATELLISNCHLPPHIPTDDREWSMFGYTLFWFAKHKREIVIPFEEKQFSNSMSSGDIQSKADAILGIHEQNCKEYYNTAIEVLSARMIEELCIVHFSVTDTEVQCYCVPPIFDNQETTNEPENFNFVWRNKILDILERMYPDKEYIEVNLLGVDLLQDLGIQAHDHKARIEKSNRHNVWITEINSWASSRIDYCYRPNSWETYINQIDQIRNLANKLISNTIAYIEFLYKKQRHSNARWEKLTSDLSNLKQLLSQNVLLPKTVVDPYCLFREGMKDKTLSIAEKRSSSFALSFDLYKNFRKSFSDAYMHIEAFFDQFADVLLARINKGNFDKINNPRLSLINLYDSAKAIYTMQKEYKLLFFSYQTLEVDFEYSEIEGILTLVNMWGHVLDNSIRGLAIAYSAKQQYRKSSETIEQANKKAYNLINGEVRIIDDQTYFLIDFNPFSGDLHENEYQQVIHILQDAYQTARPYNSVRWHFETHASEMIYVPMYNGVPLSSGFRLPTYWILDNNESQTMNQYFPHPIPASLYCILGKASDDLNQWQLASGYLSTMKMLIAQYNDVIDTLFSSNSYCESGVIQYITLFADKLSELASNFSDSIMRPLKALEFVVDEDVAKAFGTIDVALEEMKTVFDQISKLEKLEGLEQKLNTAAGCMLLLQPYLVK